MGGGERRSTRDESKIEWKRNLIVQMVLLGELGERASELKCANGIQPSQHVRVTIGPLGMDPPNFILLLSPTLNRLPFYIL